MRVDCTNISMYLLNCLSDALSCFFSVKYELCGTLHIPVSHAQAMGDLHTAGIGEHLQ